jgi:hypothetical protein
LSEAIVRTNTSTFRGGYSSHGKQFIENLPVPIPTERQRSQIEAMVAELLDANAALADARTPHERTLHSRRAQALRSRIEGRITSLFGLSAADMDIVSSVPVHS